MAKIKAKHPQSGRLETTFFLHILAIPPARHLARRRQTEGMFGVHNASSAGTLTPSMISRLCASLIPAEYNP